MSGDYLATSLRHGMVASLSLPADPPTAVTLTSVLAVATGLWGSILLLLVTAVIGVTILMLLFNRRLAIT